MSLPEFSRQGSLFSVDNLLGEEFAQDDRFRLFARHIHPLLVQARPQLQRAYCAHNGRPGLEPVLLLGVSLLQFMERVPDRQAAQMLRYHLGWKLALQQQLGLDSFDPSTLVYFRQRLLQHEQAKLAFDAVLQGLRQAGLLSRQARQRLDSTHVLGLVARLSLLELLRETLRLALKELDQQQQWPRPPFWMGLWERYVENKLDYRLEEPAQRQKQLQAGQDMLMLLQWARQQEPAVAQGQQMQLLARVLAENFQQQEQQEAGQGTALLLHPQPAGAVKNPHDPQACWCTKGSDHQKDWIGYKLQVAETVPDRLPTQREKGEPTEALITAIETQPATGSEEAGMQQVLTEQQKSGLPTPPELFVDSGYVSGQAMQEATQAGWELVGPAQEPTNRGNLLKSDAFDVDVPQRRAICPAGQLSSNCSRLEEKASGRISYRLEWNQGLCQACRLRDQCVGRNQNHRTLLVGEHHQHLQQRRREQKTEAFQQRMHQRNGIEGTHSELVRGHGLRRARYRGLAKMRLQSYLSGAACNVKRWLARLRWQMRQAVRCLLASAAAASEAASS